MAFWDSWKAAVTLSFCPSPQKVLFHSLHHLNLGVVFYLAMDLFKADIGVMGISDRLCSQLWCHSNLLTTSLLFSTSLASPFRIYWGKIKQIQPWSSCISKIRCWVKLSARADWKLCNKGASSLLEGVGNGARRNLQNKTVHLWALCRPLEGGRFPFLLSDEHQSLWSDC